MVLSHQFCGLKSFNKVNSYLKKKKQQKKHLISKYLYTCNRKSDQRHASIQKMPEVLAFSKPYLFSHYGQYLGALNDNICCSLLLLNLFMCILTCLS